MMNRDDLTEAERRVVDAAAEGEICDFGDGDPAEGADWGEERTVRASVIYDLCCGTRPEWRVHARGVRVRGALVKGRLDFRDAALRCPLGLVSCHFPEPIECSRAFLPVLGLDSSYCHGLRARGLVCRRSVFLTGTCVKGEVCLVGATLRGVLNCHGAKLENPQGVALNADGLHVRAITLKKATVKGEVRFVGATSRGQLSCDLATLENPRRIAVLGDQLDCRGSVSLKSATVKGEIRLVGAVLRAQLDLSRATLENPIAVAVDATNLDCQGIDFRLAQVDGHIRVLDARIASQFVFTEAGLSGDLRLYGADIKGTLWIHPTLDSKIDLTLTGSKVGTLDVNLGPWLREASLKADGLRYERFCPSDLSFLMQWLAKTQWSAQPYEYLAAVLTSDGRRASAKRILIAKEKRRVRDGDDPWPTKLGLRLLGVVIGYGYKPARSLLWAFLLWLLGLGIFSLANSDQIMAPSNPRVMAEWAEHRRMPNDPDYRDYPAFQPAIYSLDTMLPVIDLHVEPFWEPSVAKSGPRWPWISLAQAVWVYLRLHIALGWILTTLAILGFSGVVRQD